MKYTVSSSDRFLPQKCSHLVCLYSGDSRAFDLATVGLETSWKLLEPRIQAQRAKKAPETLEFLTPGGEPELVLAPVAEKRGLDLQDRFRLAASGAFLAARSRAAVRLAFLLNGADAETVRAAMEGVLVAGYQFLQYKSEKPTSDSLKEVVFVASSADHKAAAATLSQLSVLWEGVALCRDLVNETGSILTPDVFAKRAEKEAKPLGIKVRIRQEKQLAAEGFNGLLTVGKGSDHPPRMVTLSYEGKGASAALHLGLVGKGVTFDTGGISLKPGAGMWEMKCDMAGAAAVLGAMCAIARLEVPIRVTAVLCLAENRPGNASVLPGDIFKAKNGKTVMVDNTDAEGRLILTDGLAEAGAHKVTHLLDLATLTGAIVRAIGPAMTGLFCKDTEFSARLVEAGRTFGEKLWPMPLEEEYREYLDDPAADMKNIGKPEAGAITAALFLQEFVPEVKAWAHLDIAGTAFTTAPWKYYSPGATGWGVRTLVQLAKTLAEDGRK